MRYNIDSKGENSMENTQVKEYDTKLYLALYGYPKAGNAQKIWEEISLEQGDKGLLREAIKPIMSKEGEKMMQAPTICDCILKDFKKIDWTIYQELVDLIYTFPTVARTKAGGTFRKSNSAFLVQTLQNHDLILDEMQKFAAVTEALSMPGSVRPFNYETKKQDMSQIYGTTPFDIRYEILMNPNWTIEEKANLIYDFYEKDEDFDRAIHAWEEEIVNTSSFYSQKGFQAMHSKKSYDYSKEELAKYYPDENQKEDMIEKIRMYELFHQMRPQKEKSYQKSNTLLRGKW